MPSRRTFLARLSAAGALGAVSSLAGCGSPGADVDTTTKDGTNGPGDGTSPGDRPTSVGTELVADGFVAPIGLEQPAGDDRLFVADQPGTIHVVPPDGDSETFLDLRDRIVDVSGYDERGLLGLAFHPNFQTNGRFFVRYSAPPRQGTPSGYDHTAVLSEFTVDADDPTSATSAPKDSERTLLEVPEPQSNHNGGPIVFGPDDLLYVGLGDGGAANDEGRGHVEDWYVPNAGGNGQDVTENLLGSILRIDVHQTPTESDAAHQKPRASEDVDSRTDGKPYGIPETNPLVGEDGLDEHYAWGLRNPWRMSFDTLVDGETRLLVADVGQNQWEEVNLVENGGNYGWNIREGAHCFRTEDCTTQTPDGTPLLDPVLEYPHGDAAVSGVAIVGGYVARDGAIPGFDGTYVFADWRSQGRLFAANTSGDDAWTPWVVDVTGDIGPFVLAFGRDQQGALYACTSAKPGIDGTTGAIYRLAGT